MSDIWMLYSTFGNRDEALSVAQNLLENRLIACANVIGNITSLYRWEGAIQQENEVALIAKTSQKQLPAAIETIRKLHRYQLPAIVSWPLASGHAPFLEWVKNETTGE